MYPSVVSLRNIALFDVCQVLLGKAIDVMVAVKERTAEERWFWGNWRWKWKEYCPLDLQQENLDLSSNLDIPVWDYC